MLTNNLGNVFKGFDVQSQSTRTPMTSTAMIATNKESTRRPLKGP